MLFYLCSLFGDMFTTLIQGLNMGKGMTPKKGYDQKKYDENYDSIDWSKTRKNKKNKK
jgi:hypothetical protein